MAKPYSDDLRRRTLEALERGEGSELELAARFRVSYGYVKKIRRQQLRTGTMLRGPHRPGRKPKLTEPIRAQLRSWLKQQPDLTLVELQDKLREDKQLGVSRPSFWVVLKKMGLRLKKSHSTPAKGTQTRIENGAKSSSQSWPRSRRRS
jgi:transposase